jgi:hypothetical protein
MEAEVHGLDASQARVARQARVGVDHPKHARHQSRRSLVAQETAKGWSGDHDLIISLDIQLYDRVTTSIARVSFGTA